MTLVSEKQKIKIKISGFDYSAVDNAAKDIFTIAQCSGAQVSGPVPLPTRKNVVTVNRSPHVDKKSMEQFETRTHYRLIEIIPTAGTVDELRKLNLPAGVHVDIDINI